ncbi:LANO_0H17656g1_1 [Lachancea nothofagi CBS 11611]|uniref:LANO_0H17656g1_1 n=1 Tax=Lachancea nothofagi CBS 11611 TaxID=1266666 RepID=A0A1G4KN79_9SACH|nr:LANO_0H17656g1_1 [Lachancea nothofagi CBS 11611]
MPIQLWGKDQIKVVYEQDRNDDFTPWSAQHSNHFQRPGLSGLIHKVKSGAQRFTASASDMSIWRIGITHWTMLTIWLVLLAKFSTLYAPWYARSAILTTLCTNAILFGISDILAQCISQYNGSTNMQLPQFLSFEPAESLDLDIEDNVSMFNDYGPSTTINSEEGPVSFTKKSGFGFYRWFCFMAWGSGLAFFQVPWYRILNFLYTEDPTVVQTLERVLSDQLVYSPISLYCFFMYSNYVIEKGDSTTFKAKIGRVYLGTLGFNYVLWPPVQFINFLLMPKHFQVPFSSSIGVLWNCFLSIRNASNSL